MGTIPEDDLQLQLVQLLALPAIPEQAAALRKLAGRLHETGHAEAALAALEAAAERGVQDSGLWQAITGLRLQLQLPQLALAAAQIAVELAPDSVEARYNLALLLEQTGQLEDALAEYRLSLDILPTHYGSLCNLPLLLAKMGMQQEARAAGERALQACPDDPWLHFNQGDLLIGMRAAAAAEEAFRRALALSPDFHRARYALSIALAAQGGVRQALAERAQALAKEPTLQQDYSSPLTLDEGMAEGDVSPERVAVIAAFEELRIDDWHRYAQIVELYAGLVRGEYGNPPLDQHEMPYCGLALPVAADVQRQMARQAARRVQREVAGMRLRYPPRHSDRPLRIAYLSANFRPHPNARLMGGLYARHDRSRFKVHAYSLGPVEESPERQRVIDGVDVFRDLGALPVQAAAQLIANDGIDILVDLSGYTRHARPGILALRPAPVQVSYLGFPGTQGAPWIDYTLLDRYVLQPREREYWDERIVYLPHSNYHCELPQDLPPLPSRASLGLPGSGLVLGALHHPRKLEPSTWACWMDLLKRMPHACLWLICEAPVQKDQLIRNAANCGLAADRLIFSPQASQAEHLSRLRHADLFLDTFVYTGHTTTVDALGVGVPVVTLSGSSVVARIAGSMLRAHGLPELVATSEEEYRDLVLRLASDEAWRASLRRRAGDHANSNLFCPQRKLQQMEAAYETMWARYQAGLPPEDFDVSE